MYDATARLIHYVADGYDRYGNPVETEEAREVYVQPRSVYRSEFYDASRIGLRPSITLYMTNRADYHGEKVVEFEGVTYTVIRADWTAQRDGIALICEERIQDE